jgi:hypothetical protein
MAYMILCVRFTCLVRPVVNAFTEKHQLIPNSATGATLDTGGWLGLTRQGLSPCKMHQASLDALTLKTAARSRVRLLLLVK